MRALSLAFIFLALFALGLTLGCLEINKTTFALFFLIFSVFLCNICGVFHKVSNWHFDRCPICKLSVLFLGFDRGVPARLLGDFLNVHTVFSLRYNYLLDLVILFRTYLAEACLDITPVFHRVLESANFTVPYVRILLNYFILCSCCGVLN